MHYVPYNMLISEPNKGMCAARYEAVALSISLVLLRTPRIVIHTLFSETSLQWAAPHLSLVKIFLDTWLG